VNAKVRYKLIGAEKWGGKIVQSEELVGLEGHSGGSSFGFFSIAFDIIL
jgi:hypothetical protein